MNVFSTFPSLAALLSAIVGFVFLVGNKVKMPCPPLNNKVQEIMFYKKKKSAKDTSSQSLLTIGSYSDEGSSGEEQDKNHVTAEKKPAQRRQVVEPGGGVGVQCFMEESLEVGLTSECTNGP